MANPQKESGGTIIANEILEAIIRSNLNGTEYACLLLVIRKTYGWNKKEDRISISQFMKSIPMSRTSIINALQTLQIGKFLILIEKSIGCKTSNKYSLNKNYEQWRIVQKTVPVQKTVNNSQENCTGIVKKTGHTKYTYQNTLYKIQEGIFSDQFLKYWNLYLKHREEKGSNFTPTAQEVCLDMLKEWGEKRAIEAIKYTIAMGWDGIRENESEKVEDKNGGIYSDFDQLEKLNKHNHD